MARKPEMTPLEIEAQLPPRPIRVNADNRQTVRKWLISTAHHEGWAVGGNFSGFCYGLSMTELALAYNGQDDGLGKIKRKWLEMPQEDRQDDNEITPAIAVPVPDAAPQSSPDIVAAIQAIAAQVTPKASGVDEAAVRAIVRDEFPKLVPVTRIEIVQGEIVRDMGPMPTHPKFPRLVSALAAGLHVMLVGPAGSGKTHAAELAFKALERQFRIEGAVSGEHKLTGYSDGYGKYHSTPFRDAFEHGHGFVKDEIDADDPAALLALNSAMANGYAAFPDKPEPVLKGESFIVVACANTYGRGADRQYVGRNQLDAATLDRFVVLDWDYDETLEKALCSNEQWVIRVQSIRKAVAAEKARIVVSMRASINGAKLLAAGWPQNEVEESVIWKGTDSDLRRRIQGRISGDVR